MSTSTYDALNFNGNNGAKQTFFVCFTCNLKKRSTYLFLSQKSIKKIIIKTQSKR